MPRRDDGVSAAASPKSRFLAMTRVISPSCPRSWAARRSQWRKRVGNTLTPSEQPLQEDGAAWARVWVGAPCPALRLTRLATACMMGARLRKRTEARRVGRSVPGWGAAIQFPLVSVRPADSYGLSSSFPRPDPGKWGWLPSSSLHACGFPESVPGSALCWKLKMPQHMHFLDHCGISKAVVSFSLLLVALVAQDPPASAGARRSGSTPGREGSPGGGSGTPSRAPAWRIPWAKMGQDWSKANTLVKVTTSSSYKMHFKGPNVYRNTFIWNFF